MSSYPKDRNTSTNLHGISRFRTNLWETTKPTIVLTDNKSVTRFFQTIAIPPAFWNACDYVLQLNFRIARIVGSVNTTVADFFPDWNSELRKRYVSKSRRTYRRKTPIEVTTSSSDVADEGKFFLAKADNGNKSEGHTLQRKEQSRQNAKEWVADEEPSSSTTSVKEITKVDGNTTPHSMNGCKANAQIRVQQDVELTFKNLKVKILGQLYDEVLLTTDRRYKPFKAKEDRIILKDGLLFQNYYRETGSVKYYYFLIPEQLVDEVLRNLHGEFGRHRGITITANA